MDSAAKDGGDIVVPLFVGWRVSFMAIILPDASTCGVRHCVQLALLRTVRSGLLFNALKYEGLCSGEAAVS